MKQSLFLILFTIWVLALVVPAIVQVVEKNDPVLVYNIAEEENKEKLSWEPADQEQYTNLSLGVPLFQAGILKVFCLAFPMILPSLLFKIILPPPKPFA